TKSGDLNSDQIITKEDVTSFIRYFTGYSGNALSVDTADIDKDGKITRRDAMILARYVAGWDGYNKYFNR
ncbi:MAG: hypothetical protein IJB52_11235, partial [Clostridia bacterium]|nr:hypothetical protein [Clostridia bacterium]